jgi:hypothetical protein
LDGFNINLVTSVIVVLAIGNGLVLDIDNLLGNLANLGGKRLILRHLQIQILRHLLQRGWRSLFHHLRQSSLRSRIALKLRLNLLSQAFDQIPCALQRLLRQFSRPRLNKLIKGKIGDRSNGDRNSRFHNDFNDFYK